MVCEGMGWMESEGEGEDGIRGCGNCKGHVRRLHVLGGV